jgi:hypothetical protein
MALEGHSITEGADRGCREGIVDEVRHRVGDPRFQVCRVEPYVASKEEKFTR